LQTKILKYALKTKYIQELRHRKNKIGVEQLSSDYKVNT